MRERGGKGFAAGLLPWAPASCGGWLLLCALRLILRPGPGLNLLLSAAGTVVFCLAPVSVILLAEGKKIRLALGAPEPEHIVSSVLCGALAVFPFSLMEALTVRAGLPGMLPAVGPAGILPSLLYCLLFAPAAQGLYFRGWLEDGLRFAGAGRALALSSALFALTADEPAGILPCFCLGVMLSLLMRAHRSIVSSMLSHSAFLTASLFARQFGLLPSGLGLGAAVLCAAGSFGWYFAFRRAMGRRPALRRIRLKMEPFTARERALLAAAAALTVLASLLAGVMA